MAIILGAVVGGLLLQFFKHNTLIIGGFLLFIALIGSTCSLFIGKVPPSGATKSFSVNPWQEPKAVCDLAFGGSMTRVMSLSHTGPSLSLNKIWEGNQEPFAGVLYECVFRVGDSTKKGARRD